MRSRLFISYSRRQTPFVDALAARLTKGGFPLWLDYQDLVPARPWRGQIEAGIAGAEVFLLIVSPESMASEEVQIEYQHALRLGKRIVLVLFAATPLPEELQDCEWVDFRLGIKASLDRLIALLSGARSQSALPVIPQRGFKAPFAFWTALILSIVLVIGSLPAVWTGFIPYVLLPLPWQIYRRNYPFQRVLPVLLVTPVIVFFSLLAIVEGYWGWAILPNPDLLAPARNALLGGIGRPLLEFILPFEYVLRLQDSPSLYLFDMWVRLIPVLSLGLFLLLASGIMQQRGGPESARVRFADPFKSEMPEPRPVPFVIDHAPEDSRFADALRTGLERGGHRPAGPGEAPEAVFVVLSAHKTSTNYDPDSQAVYPVLLQTVRDVDPKLGRIQWLDFRRGLRNLDKLARLLPEPALLLRALAVPPTGNQEVYPFSVNILQIFYLLTGVFTGVSVLTLFLVLASGVETLEGLRKWLEYSLIFSGSANPPSVLLALFNGVMLPFAMLHARRALRTRTGGAAAWQPVLVLSVFQVVMYIGTAVYMVFANFFALATGWLYLILLPVVLLILVIRRQELRHWFPVPRQDTKLRPFERLLLLHVPVRRSAIPLHAAFHATLIAMLTLLALFLAWMGIASPNVESAGQFLGYFNPILLAQMALLLTAILLRWQAGRLSK